MFRCRSELVEADVLLFLETEVGPITAKNVEATGENILELVNRRRILVDVIETSGFEVYSDTCSLQIFDKTLSFPVELVGTMDFQVAILTVASIPKIFDSGVQSMSIRPLSNIYLSTFILSMLAEGGTPLVNNKQNMLPIGQQTPKLDDNQGRLSSTINEMGLITPESRYTRLEFLGVAGIKGFLSTKKEGLTFSTHIFDKFIGGIKSIVGDRLVKREGGFIVKDCSTMRNGDVTLKNPELFEISFSLEGLGGNGIRFMPHTFLTFDHDVKSACALRIFEDKSLNPNEVILGDSFFQSVELQFSSEGLKLDPLRLYSPVHSVKNIAPLLPEDDGKVVTLVKRSDTSSDDESSTNSGLIIGIAVGGTVLIIAVITFLTIRAKRRQHTQIDRYSASRPMVADPSEISVSSQ
jgi:hypothetical protein